MDWVELPGDHRCCVLQTVGGIIGVRTLAWIGF